MRLKLLPTSDDPFSIERGEGGSDVTCAGIKPRLNGACASLRQVVRAVMARMLSEQTQRFASVDSCMPCPAMQRPAHLERRSSLTSLVRTTWTSPLCCRSQLSQGSFASHVRVSACLSSVPQGKLLRRGSPGARQRGCALNAACRFRQSAAQQLAACPRLWHLHTPACYFRV